MTISTVEQLRALLAPMPGERQVLVDLGEDFEEISETEDVEMEGTQGALILRLAIAGHASGGCPFCSAPSAEDSRWCPRCREALSLLASQMTPLEGKALTFAELERLNWSYDIEQGMVMDLENWMPVGGPMPADEIAKGNLRRVEAGGSHEAYGHLWAASPELAILALQVVALNLPDFLAKLTPGPHPLQPSLLWQTPEELVAAFKESAVYTTLLARQALRLANVAGSGA